MHKNIQTADDYLMDMHRIPRGLNNQNVTNRPVVLLMHGLMGSAENWIVNGPKKSLAYILADQGYDVWMGNNRGTIHSRKHVRFDPDFDTAYWQFRSVYINSQYGFHVLFVLFQLARNRDL